MIFYLTRHKDHLSFKIIHLIIIFAFFFSFIPTFPVSRSYAQAVPVLPPPGVMVPLTSDYDPPILLGLKIYPENALKFDFIVDRGEDRLEGEIFKDASQKLIKFFLAALTVPEEDLWVNLSPYEGDKIIPGKFGMTEMGRDLLAQDYILKQLTASLMYPQQGLGKAFWDKVYQKAKELYGTTNIPINTFNKVWIVPDKAVVYENGNTALVIESHLKVLLEEDYLALKHNMSNEEMGTNKLDEDEVKTLSNISSEVVKEVILPAIEKEINEGKNFALLRQIYHSIILASWYKEVLQESFLGKLYIDKNKIKGIKVDDEQIKQKIYEQYLEAFKKGVFNFVREDYEQESHETIQRTYFSGGTSFQGLRTSTDGSPVILKRVQGDESIVPVRVHNVIEGRANLVTTNINTERPPNEQKVVATSVLVIPGWKKIAVEARTVGEAMTALTKQLTDEKIFEGGKIVKDAEIILANRTGRTTSINPTDWDTVSLEEGDQLTILTNTGNFLAPRGESVDDNASFEAFGHPDQAMLTKIPVVTGSLQKSLLEVSLSLAETKRVTDIENTLAQIRSEQSFPSAQVEAFVQELYGIGDRVIPYLIRSLNNTTSINSDIKKYDTVELASYNLKNVIFAKAIQRFGSTAVPYLQAAILEKSKSYQSKKGVLIELLSDVNDPRVGPLIRKVGYSNPKSIEALGRLNLRDEIPKLRALLNLKIDYKIPRIGEYRNQKNFEQIIAAIKALSLMQDEGSVDDIIRLFRSLSQDWKKFQVLEAIQGFAHSQYLPLLREYAQREEAPLEEQGQEPSTAPYYVAKLKQTAVIALVFYGTDESLDILMSYIPKLERYPRGFVDDLLVSLSAQLQFDVIVKLLDRMTPQDGMRHYHEYLLDHLGRLAQSQNQKDALDYLHMIVDARDVLAQLLQAHGDLESRTDASRSVAFSDQEEQNWISLQTEMLGYLQSLSETDPKAAQVYTHVQNYRRQLERLKDKGNNYAQHQYTYFNLLEYLKDWKGLHDPAVQVLSDLTHPDNLDFLNRWAMDRTQDYNTRRGAFNAIPKTGTDGQRRLQALYQSAQDPMTLLAMMPALFSIPGYSSGEVDDLLRRLADIHGEIPSQDLTLELPGKRYIYTLDDLFLDTLETALPLYTHQIIRFLINNVPGGSRREGFRRKSATAERFYNNFVLETGKLLSENRFNATEPILDAISSMLNDDDKKEFLRQIIDRSESFTIKRQALERLIPIVPKEESAWLYEYIRKIITYYKISPLNPDFNQEERQFFRRVAVAALPRFKGSYRLSVALFKDELEHPIVREAARRNLQKYAGTYKESQEISFDDHHNEIEGYRTFQEEIKLKNQPILKRIQAGIQEVRRDIAALYLEIRSRYILKHALPIADQKSSFYAFLEGFLNTPDKEAPDLNAGATPSPLTSTVSLDRGGPVLDIDPQHAPTPRLAPEQDNSFIQVLSDKTEKSKEEIQMEADDFVLKEHYKMMTINGFIDREDGPQAEVLYRIFDRVVEAYNKHATFLNKPAFRGKFFIVDSPMVKAFAFAEHDDFYVHLGLIRELAHFSKLYNVPFSEDLVAAIFSHELTHVLQNTAFEGISFSDLQDNKALASEVFDLKRQAEYNADEGAIILLSFAGYAPETVLTALQFLRTITRETTAESAVETHPHPKERISHIENLIENESRVLADWKEETTPLDANMFLNWNPGHVGSNVSQIHSLDDVITQLNSAKTIQEVMELTKIARYLESRLYALKLAESDDAKESLARELYMDSVLDVMKAVIDRKRQQSREEPQHSLKLASPEGRLVMRLTAKETSLPDADEEFYVKLENEFLQNVGLESYLTQFGKRVATIRQSVRLSELDAADKMSLLTLIDRIYLQGLTGFKEKIDAGSLAAFVDSPPEQQTDFENIIAAIADRDEMGALDQLLAHPFSLYMVYGQTALDETMDIKTYLKSPVAGATLSRTGIDFTKIDLDQLHLERSDSGFYDKDLRLLPLTTREERAGLIQSLVIDHVLQVARVNDNWQKHAPSSWAGKLYPISRDLQDAIYNATLRTAPAVPKEIIEAREQFLTQQEDQFREEGIGQPIFKERATSYDDQLKRALALYLSGHEDFRDETKDGMIQEDLKDYLRSTVVTESEQIFSDVFTTEYQINQKRNFRDVLGFLDYDSYDRPRFLNYRYLELQDKTDSVLFYLSSHISDSDPWAQRKSYIRAVLGNFSIHFRKKILDDLASRLGFSLILTLFEFQELTDGLIFPSDAYDIVKKFAGGYLRGGITGINLKADAADKDIRVFEWLIDHKPKSLPALDKEFLYSYLSLRLYQLQLKMRQDYEQRTGQDFNNLSTREVRTMAKAYLTKEFVFDLMNKLSRAGVISFEEITGRDLKVWGEENDYALGVLKREDYDAIKKEIEDSDDPNKMMKIEIPSSEVPVAFFNAPSHILDQVFFRMIFDLDLEQLQALAKNQTHVREEMALKRGRLEELPPTTPAQELIDHLIILKMLDKENIYTVPVSSEDLDSVFKGTMVFRKGNDFSRGGIAMTVDSGFVPFLLWPQDNKRGAYLRQVLIDQFQLDSSDSRVRAKAFEFFQRLKTGGLIAKNSDMDTLWVEIAKTSIGLLLFVVYADLMVDMQIPEVQPQALDATADPRTYLQVLVQAVDVVGTKANIFKRFDQRISNLLSSTDTLERRLAILEYFLPKANLFRDGFIDLWERRLVPEVDLSALERREIERYIELQRKKGRLSESDQYTLFETIGLMTPFQWGKIKDDDDEKKERKKIFNVATERVKAILEFYRSTIPLVADPQRQLRMGATAIRIFRHAYPNASFQEEREAIESFLPFASDLRDEELNTMLSRHVIPSETVSTEDLTQVRMMYTAYQSMQYNEEVTNANYAEQMMKAILSMASRESRKEILFWILDPASFPKPKLIYQLKDKFNIDFDELPYHVSLMPETYRMKTLQDIFLGENGLFVDQGKENGFLDRFLDDLFVQFFPSPESQQRGFFSRKRGQLDPDVYKIVRNVFPQIMKKYSASRRTAITISLLRYHDRLRSMSDGEKLAILLSALGPVGVKLGQILSERKNIIRSDSLRSDLGKLKKSAPPISKLAVLEVLLQAGFNQRDASGQPIGYQIRIGKLLAAASMKQVHEGWILIGDEWKRVVIKVLRPRIGRTINNDLSVLVEVLDYLHQTYGYGVEHIARTVRRWINTERDFRNESSHVEKIREALRDFQLSLPAEERTDFKIDDPIVIVGDQMTVMIEEMVTGMEVGSFLKPKWLRGWMQGDGWRTNRSVNKELKARGFTENQAKTIAAISKSRFIDKLRKMHLFMMSKIGRFHADLHSDNVMLNSEGDLDLIDLGLIGEFAPEQSEGLNKVLKGLLLHDPAIVFEGIKDIHVYSNDVPVAQRQALSHRIDAERAEIQKELAEVFSSYDFKNVLKNFFFLQRLKTIDDEMNDILNVVIQRNFDGNDDFSTAIKALTTSSWLFPMGVFSAKKTLDSVADVVGLSAAEKWKVMFMRGWPVLKNSVDIALKNLITDIATMVNRWLAPIAAAIADLQKKFKLWRLTREMIGNVSLLLRGNKKQIVGRETQENDVVELGLPNAVAVKTFQSKAGSLLLGRVEFSNNNETSLNDIQTNFYPEQLAALDVSGTLTSEQKVMFEESIQIYLKINLLLAASKEFGLDLDRPDEAPSSSIRKERFLAQVYSQREFGRVLEGRQLVARILTSRIMAQKYLAQQEQGSASFAYLDFLSPQNPLLKDIAERWADLYLASLDDRDASNGFMKNDEGRNARRRTLLMTFDPSLSLRVTGFGGVTVEAQILKDHSGVLTHAVHKVEEAGPLPLRYANEAIRWQLKIEKDEMKPGKYRHVSDQKTIVAATRTGYTQEGRFELDFINVEDNRLIHLSLTEKEFDRLTDTGEANSVSSDLWEAQTVELLGFESGQPKIIFPEMRDAAMLRDFQPENLTLEGQAKTQDPLVRYSAQRLTHVVEFSLCPGCANNPQGWIDLRNAFSSRRTLVNASDYSVQESSEENKKDNPGAPDNLDIKSRRKSPPGGIDLSPKNFDLEIKRNGQGVVIPFDEKNLKNIQIDGLVPEIIKITPIPSLPLLLGGADHDNSPKLSFVLH